MGDGWETQAAPRHRPRHPRCGDDLVRRAGRSATSRDRHQPLRLQRVARSGGAGQPRATVRRTRLGAGAVRRGGAAPHPHRTRCQAGLRRGRRGHHRAAGAGLSRRRHRARPGLRTPPPSTAPGATAEADREWDAARTSEDRRVDCRADDRMQRTVAAHRADRQPTGHATPAPAWHGCRASPRTSDTRGFAGRLSQHGDVFEWQRHIDIEPPGPFPDAGRMRWEAGDADRGRRARGLRRTLDP